MLHFCFRGIEQTVEQIIAGHCPLCPNTESVDLHLLLLTMWTNQSTVNSSYSEIWYCIVCQHQNRRFVSLLCNDASVGHSQLLPCCNLFILRTFAMHLPPKEQYAKHIRAFPLMWHCTTSGSVHLAVATKTLRHQRAFKSCPTNSSLSPADLRKWRGTHRRNWTPPAKPHE